MQPPPGVAYTMDGRNVSTGTHLVKDSTRRPRARSPADVTNPVGRSIIRLCHRFCDRLWPKFYGTDEKVDVRGRTSAV